MFSKKNKAPVTFHGKRQYRGLSLQAQDLQQPIKAMSFLTCLLTS